MKQEFINAFIKGIAKTSAAFTVFGIVGSIWYGWNVYKQSKIETENESDKIEIIHDIKDEIDSEYKSLFDKLTI